LTQLSTTEYEMAVDQCFMRKTLSINREIHSVGVNFSCILGS